MSRSCDIGTMSTVALRNFRSALFFILGVLVLSSVGQAELVDFNNDNAWDDNPDTPHFVLNGAPLAESLPSKSDSLINGTFNWRQEFVRNEDRTIKSIAFNGAAAENPHIHQHVFSYTQSDNPSTFMSANTTSHTRTFVLGPEDFGLASLKRKKITLLSNVILDGSLLFVKDSEQDVNYKDMAASFEVKVFKETTTKRGKLKRKKVFSGKVTLKPQKNGKVKVSTRGKIKKKHIGSIDIIDGSLFQINFDKENILYKNKVRVGEEFSLVTEVTGIAVNKGYGTGAEVIFGPGLPGEIPIPTIPTYHLSNEIVPIPEPATLILLAGGGIMMLRPRSRKIRVGGKK